MNWYVNYELRDSADNPVGWFMLLFDAEACRKGQSVPENYTIHWVNKRVGEDEE
jgi:hypothetical protein